MWKIPQTKAYHKRQNSRVQDGINSNTDLECRLCCQGKARERMNYVGVDGASQLYGCAKKNGSWCMEC